MLRLLNSDAIPFDLTTLGMSDAMLEISTNSFRFPTASSLWSVPPEAGKTTTLYTVISQLNDFKKKYHRRRSVEYKLRLCQMQSFQSASLASGLRSSSAGPDIILVR